MDGLVKGLVWVGTRTERYGNTVFGWATGSLVVLRPVFTAPSQLLRTATLPR